MNDSESKNASPSIDKSFVEFEFILLKLIADGVIVVWDKEHKSLKSVLSVGINGNCIQMNVEPS